MKAIIAISLIIPTILWKSFVFLKLYNWFPAVIYDLPPIAMAQSAGILCLVSMLTYHLAKTDEDDYVASIAAGFVTPALCLLIGWIITLFM